MASDRARISFDPTREYRSVIAQQGRVTLEADVNEAGVIALETLRLETLDIVGPTGTPDDGYRVIPIGGGLSIGAGIMYLGGWRLSLDAPVDVAKQPDWLDQTGLKLGGTEVVSLLVTEQSVCAVEDQALRDVALGGPDSAARLRLMQQFIASPIQGDTCADGASTITGLLAEDGVTWDANSLQLISSARLEVGFVPPTTPPDPCTPTAAGGYLGADNQLIRVTVTAFDPTAKTGSLLWGWNNASFLYRATSTDAAAGVMTLTGVPVDQEHAPQLGQAVEILRSRTNLGDNDFIAADAGFVTTIKQAYSFDTGTLTLTDPLPAAYANDPNPLFVRLWQAIVPFNSGQPAALDTTSGLTVTISMTALPSHIAARPFWRFAVRPNTPVQVYPARYQEAPQPPDGPRQWLCDLAVVGPIQGGFQVLADCRVPFNPLTQLQAGGCCGVTLDPAGVDAKGGMQAVVDALGPGGTLSLKHGTYILRRPLLLNAKHNGLTIEACAPGTVVLEADPKTIKDFAAGLVTIRDARLITLRDIEFKIEPVPTKVTRNIVTAYTVAGATIAHTYGVTFDGCHFRFNLTPVGAAQAAGSGAGIMALLRVQGLTVRRCEFLGTEFIGTHSITGIMSTLQTTNVTTTFDDVEITGCLFQRINIGVLGFAHLGMIRCTGNKVRDCAVGFAFADANQGAAASFIRAAGGDAATGFAQGLQAGFRADLLTNSMEVAAPFFSHVEAEEAKPPAAAAQRPLRAAMTKDGTDAFASLAKAATPQAAAGAAPAANTAAPRAAAAPRPALEEASLANLGTLENVAIAAELISLSLDPVLHVKDNDLVLVSPGGETGFSIGIMLLFSIRPAKGSLLMVGNRVMAPDVRSIAGYVLHPVFAAISANIFAQPTRSDQTPAFLLTYEESAHVEVMGNVIHSVARITPPRSTGALTNSWDFLNTEG